MFTVIMKLVSAAALLLAALFSPSANYQIGLQFLVCVAACVVFSQAVQSRKLWWALAFVAAAILFNPVIPVPLVRSYSLGLDLLCLVAFAASLLLLKSPKLSIASITDRTPGSESL